jgi:hypothetical protein
MKVFVPYSESLPLQIIDALGLSSTDLVPFQLDYQCVQVYLDEASVQVDLDRSPQPEFESAFEVVT